MRHWFSAISTGSEFSADALRCLKYDGFVVITGPVTNDRLPQLARAYDSAVEGAASGDVSIGSTTTRVTDFVNRNPQFDSLYTYAPVLEAGCHIIGRPFRLSTMHARTVRPHSQAQDLHVDFEHDVHGWPLRVVRRAR